MTKWYGIKESNLAQEFIGFHGPPEPIPYNAYFNSSFFDCKEKGGDYVVPSH